MALFRLTESNVQFVKHELRKALPNVKSSHHTEAMAAGFGFRTNAALIAELIASTQGAEPLVRIDEDQWLHRLCQLGYDVGSNSTLITCARSPHLPDPCWREFGRGQIDAADEWHRQCQSQNIPYIWFEIAQKYAKLRWDCISLDPHYEHAIRHNDGRECGKLLFALFQKCSQNDPGKPRYFGSAFTGDIERILPATARTIADEFFTALYRASREWKARYPDDLAPAAQPALSRSRARRKAA